VLTRAEVIDVRALVTVAEVTTSIRRLAAEVEFDFAGVGLKQPSVISCDGVHTVTRSSLTSYVGTVNEQTMAQVCRALIYALGC
jgi:mRNA-degrading endonuclease toxin of MazEF toxin-antitoxin module